MATLQGAYANHPLLTSPGDNVGSLLTPLAGPAKGDNVGSLVQISTR